MKPELTDILDACLADLLSDEVSLEECLSRYPDEAGSLRPLLELALQARALEVPEMGSAASREVKRRMLAALAEKERRRLRSPLSLRGLAARVGGSLSGPRQIGAPVRGSMLATAAVALAVLLLAILPGSLFEARRYDVVAQSAMLADLVGVVEVQPSTDSSWRPATAGSSLSSGYHVRTASSSSAMLVFFDGSRTILSSGTELGILQVSSCRDAAARTVILNQLVGQTDNRVAEMVDAGSRFEVRTPTAVAVVRGTQFTVIVGQDGATSVSVKKGEVGVTIGGTTEVLSAGQFASVRQPDTSPEPSPTGTPVPTESCDELDKGELAQIPRPSGTATGSTEPGQPGEGTMSAASPSGTPEPTPTQGEVADDELADKDHPEHPEQPTHPGLPDQAEPDVPPGRDPDRDKGKDKDK